ncbi:glycosyltransferase family 4 protein [Sphingobium sp. CR2-8]|uniref:glycosyltransferase family 4 protein n=1 Tax=Sphingobium sp. CR2-8 TaxID=1306534 RepID=UPI002DB5789E|nr:glycosyltransferase family 4 protein [Sphingobium sp. CR2-8]MEC3912555.1 glycosyltransferase family 4 protein [Sphingobium sp. CR2-8]
MLHKPFNKEIVPAPLRHIALIGNSMPRRCGIATFTTHCRDAMAEAFPDLIVDHYAMDDGQGAIDYPADVIRVPQFDPIAYSEAARRIEESGAETIWLQHEFGIFGGPAGDMILSLIERTGLPLVSTFHTILENPNPQERRVAEALIARSSQIMVMAQRGRDILLSHYDVPDSKIAVIPHGVPDRPHVDPATMKAPLGWQDRPVILTFGLLAPDKGIDVMIRAMPDVVDRHPDALYVVLGATHPNIVREQGGEVLRNELKALASALGVERNVAFVDRYVEQEELLDQLQAADIYVTPYINPAQVTSGTLSYAVGMGKPIVSTPYVQAREVLGGDVGCLVPFRDPQAMAHALNALLDDKVLSETHASRAYAYGRTMIWSELARNVERLLSEARAMQPARLVPRRSYDILAPDMTAVLRMSDSTGMFQHSILSVPDRRHGYCIDDNARALILLSQMPTLEDAERDRWMTTYAAFVQYAWNPDRSRFRNFMAFDRSWCEDKGSEDSGGRAIWSLGVTARDAQFEKHRRWAISLFEQTAGAHAAIESPRAKAFLILGASALLDALPGHDLARGMIETLSADLMALHATRSEWTWFEDVLAYDNARLPQALLLAGQHLGDRRLIDRGLATLEWLTAKQTAPEGHFRAVGTESFGRPFGHPLPFDQQPLEAQASVDAATAAYTVTGDSHWRGVAENAYRWFLGQNDNHVPLATVSDGGCYDGLTPHGVNENQGAESILALQLASCAMNALSKRESIVPKGTNADIEMLSA